MNALQITAGAGGLHSIHTQPQVCIADENLLLIQLDVNSAYPNCLQKVTHKCEQEGLPVSVPSEFLAAAISRRDTLKQQGDPLNLTLKLMNNAYYGKISSTKSELYCPIVQMGIILNVQMSLIHLIKQSESIGKAVLVNTDGVYLVVDKTKESELERIVRDWEKTWTLKLSRTDYRALWIKDVNHILALSTDNQFTSVGFNRREAACVVHTFKHLLMKVAETTKQPTQKMVQSEINTRCSAVKNANPYSLVRREGCFLNSIPGALLCQQRVTRWLPLNDAIKGSPIGAFVTRASSPYVTVSPKNSERGIPWDMTHIDHEWTDFPHYI